MLENEKNLQLAQIEDRYYDLDMASRDLWQGSGSDGPEPIPTELTARDQRTLRNLIDDESANIRYRVAWLLSYHGPLTWADIRKWLLDTDEGVRSCAVTSVRMTSMAIGRLCAADKQRCVDLLVQSWRKYPNDRTDVEITMMAMHEDGWLDSTWRAMDRLLNSHDPEMFSRLTCGYFEDIVEYFRMGPTDPHVKSWIEGRSRKRKCVLMEIARWLRMDEDFLVEIVRAIAADRDRITAAYGRRLLAWKGLP